MVLYQIGCSCDMTAPGSFKKNNWMINDSLKVCHAGSVNYIEIVRQ